MEVSKFTSNVEACLVKVTKLSSNVEACFVKVSKFTESGVSALRGFY